MIWEWLYILICNSTSAIDSMFYLHGTYYLHILSAMFVFLFNVPLTCSTSPSRYALDILYGDLLVIIVSIESNVTKMREGYVCTFRVPFIFV